MPLAGSNPLRLVTNNVLRAWAACFGHDIFVSYARADGRPIAQALRDVYERRFLVFLDEQSIDGGENLTARIHREICKARMLVVVLTPQAFQSEWVRRECDAFLKRPGRRRRILPIFVAPITPANLPAEWRWIVDWKGDAITLSTAEALHNNQAPGPELVASAMATTEQAFTGPRQRAMALGTVLCLLLMLPMIAWYGVTARERQRVIGEHVREAAVAAADARMTEATLAIRAAREVAGEDPELRSLLKRYQQRLVLRPHTALRLPPDWRITAIGTSGDEPRFVLQDTAHNGTPRARLAITSTTSWLQLLPTPDDTQPRCVVHEGVLYAAAAGRLFRADLAAPATNVLSVPTGIQSGVSVPGFEAPEVALHDDQVLVLGFAGERLQVLTFDPITLARVGGHSIPRGEHQTTVTLSRQKGCLAFRIRNSGGLMALALTASHLKKDGAWEDIKSVEVNLQRGSGWASMLFLDKVVVAADDTQAFVAIREQDVSGASPGQLHWVALGMRLPRHPWQLEARIANLIPTQELNPFEAVYRCESGELRALSCKGLMVLDRPGITVAPHAMTWALAPQPSPEHSFRAFVATRNDFAAYDDVTARHRVLWPTTFPGRTTGEGLPPLDPLRVHVDPDGTFVALEFGSDEAGATDVLVWRCGPQVATENDAGLGSVMAAWQHDDLPPPAPK